MELPADGLPHQAVRHLLRAAGRDDMAWREGRGWSLVYDLPGDHHDLVSEAASMFAAANGLSASAFPSAGRFEAAVISMTASVVSPGRRGYGVFTSGGTESILLAVKSARDDPRYRGDEVVVPVTAHPGFGKAAAYLGLRLRRVPVGASGAVDPAALLAATGPDTLLLGASAPNFPYGSLDPIPQIAAAAAEHGFLFHVDAALGGLFLPFMSGVESADTGFGLDVPGVTSVSVDLHKYGYGAKGASVLLFADPGLRHACYHLDASWPGGAYAAPGVLGTRPVGPAAAAFASMVELGRTGYARQVQHIMQTTRRLQHGLCASGPFLLVGAPAMSVFAVTGPPDLLHRTMRGLAARGWWVDALTEPLAMHFMVFPRHGVVADRFLADAAAAQAEPAAEGDDAVSSYGVMVRGSAPTEAALRDHLDLRFDAGADGWASESPGPWPAAGGPSSG